MSCLHCVSLRLVLHMYVCLFVFYGPHCCVHQNSPLDQSKSTLILNVILNLEELTHPCEVSP